MNYSKPDFLIVGAAKSGTTSLYRYLNNHPEIHIPDVKECRFFSQLPKNFNGLGAEFFVNEGITDEKIYFNLFDKSKICGDISNDYLYYHNESIKNIKKYVGSDIKIIIVLRNPVERAYSNFMHHVRDGWESKNFEDALLSEKKRIEENWGWSYHYFNTGLYYNQVKDYVDNFTNVKILLFEDLKDQKNLDAIFKFLELKKINLDFSKEKYNASGLPKFLFIQRVFNNKKILKFFSKLLKPVTSKKIRKKLLDFRLFLVNNNLKKTNMNLATRKMLVSRYYIEIKKLESLINRDLSSWLN